MEKACQTCYYAETPAHEKPCTDCDGISLYTLTYSLTQSEINSEDIANIMIEQQQFNENIDFLMTYCDILAKQLDDVREELNEHKNNSRQRRKTNQTIVKKDERQTKRSF